MGPRLRKDSDARVMAYESEKSSAGVTVMIYEYVQL
jgi:hypothetical protein